MAGFFRRIVVFVLLFYSGTTDMADDESNSSGNGLHLDRKSCFCELQGQVDDCSCTVDTVESLNNFKIQPLLSSVLRKDFFRYYKVNLNRPCFFWDDDKECALRDCSINVCQEDDLPSGLKSSLHPQHNDEEKDGRSSEEVCREEKLSALNSTITDEARKQLEDWKSYDDSQDEFCEGSDDEHSADARHVDLLLNPERYTGYTGGSAWRVWKSIYEENCFNLVKDYGYVTSKTLGGQCLEKRAFYRAVSGLHTSISIHLCAQHFYPADNFGKGKWGYHLEEFKRRFAPEHTGGEGPVWLRNLYFVYLLELRAISKAAPYFESYEFYTGNEQEDDEVKQAVTKVLEHVKSFPNHFDESRMFQGQKHKAKALKEEFRQHFYNISRIMDCVGCNKCRLWGKLQVQGLGTALKILFSHSSPQVGKTSTVDAKSKKDFQLRRQEIVALFNAFGRLSNSVKELSDFKRLLDKE